MVKQLKQEKRQKRAIGAENEGRINFVLVHKDVFSPNTVFHESNYSTTVSANTLY